MTALTEPEEQYWPATVVERDKFGKDNAFFWFRAIRADNLMRAARIRTAGGYVFVDTIYENIRSYYIDKPSMSSLVDSKSPYFGVIKAIADVDKIVLPAQIL